MDRKVAPDLLASDAVAAATRIAVAATRGAAALDHDGSFPDDDMRGLAHEGLLAAPVPVAHGGKGLGDEPGARDLCDVLRIVGRGSLAVGRLYEGHVNALQLIGRYGDPSGRACLFADARAGHLFGVWNTESAKDGLVLEDPVGLRLRGGKTFASGAGFVTRALVTVRPAGRQEPLMLVVPLEPGTRADLSEWRAQGMRASATGTVDLTGLVVTQDAILGGPDDYHAQPYFSGGAWRFAAVQVGGIEAVLDIWRAHLLETRRGDDPLQLARLGEGLIAAESARLWVERAAALVQEDAQEADRIVSYVNLARLAVERVGLDVLQLAQRSVGLQGFLCEHPLERLSRDLATYLRQPAPDRALTSAASYVLATDRSSGDLWRHSGDCAP